MERTDLPETLGKLKTVISGHLGWVRSVAVEPGNQWFATGAGDRVIKVCPDVLRYIATYRGSYLYDETINRFGI
jgi:WD40 repeat protein